MRFLKKAHKLYFWFKVAMDVAEFMKFVYGGEHLTDIKSCMFLLQHTGIIEESPKVAPWDVFHGKIHVFWVLKGI